MMLNLSDTARVPAWDRIDLDVVVSAACAGDESAFVVLFREIEPRLLRYLRTLCGADAEDIAAETWVHVTRGMARFSGDADGFRGWVFTFAHGRMVDAWRARSRRPETITSTLPDGPSEIDVPREVEETISTDSALALLRELPHGQAQVLLLRVVAGLDVPMTAAVLGRTPNSVRVLAHRGLRALAAVVDQRATLPLVMQRESQAVFKL
jgi:RNA polymerase sigma-70 factor (ECF subfamily)